MNRPSWKLLFTLAATLGATACVIEEAPYDGAPDFGEPDGNEQDAGPEVEMTPFADIRVPTDDGAAAYRFRFATVENGPIVTLVESPLGYPEAAIPDECALDTFLRVADANAEVPRALVRECGVPQADGSRRTMREGEPPMRAGELNTAGLSLGFGRVVLPRECTKSVFDDRVNELEELASYQPLVNTNCEQECELFVAWNNTGCAFYNGDGVFQNNCSSADYTALLAQYGPFGQVCLEYGGWECDQVPNPECAHNEWIIGDWGPWNTWTRQSSNTSRTTRVRAEVTTCGSTATQGGWYAKKNANDSWGTKHNVTFSAYSTSVLVLSAGWDGNNNWRGWDFKITGQGSNFRVATAWVELQGKNRFTCPLKL